VVNPNPRLPEELLKKIISRLASEPSDTRLSEEFGVSRKTIWRLRQAPVIKVPKPTHTPRKKTVTSLQKETVPLPQEEINLSLQKDESLATTITTVPPPPPPPIEKEALQENPLPVVAVSKGPLEVIVTVLDTYFAVQLLPRESYKEVVQIVLTTANAEKILFRKIQVLDISSIGTTNFVRFRSDVQNVKIILERLKERASIVQVDGSFMIQFPDGRSGKCPAALMCATPKIGFGQTFVGTKIARWRHQFETASANPSLV